MRAPGIRRGTESLAPDRRPPPPTPTNTADSYQVLSTPVPGRESDASFCSSLPSAARPSLALPNITDRSYQVSALRTVNSYLASQSVPFSLKPPLPFAADITETLKLLLNHLGFVSEEIDDDLSHALKFLKCPLKLNISALHAPATPFSFPNSLAVIHWLVQIIKYKDFMVKYSPSFECNTMFMYAISSYYLKGNDAAMADLDEKYIRGLREWKDKLEENVRIVEENVKELEVKLEGLKAGPSQKEGLEKDMAVLEEDITKFHMMIEQLHGHLAELQKRLEEKDRALEAKLEDSQRIYKDNEELQKKIEEQGISLRDAERMKRELQAMDRDIEETEAARNGWEEKIWELGSEIGLKFKGLERFMMECNQAIRRCIFSSSP